MGWPTARSFRLFPVCNKRAIAAKILHIARTLDLRSRDFSAVLG
jgi:hypothetical protein